MLGFLSKKKEKKNSLIKRKHNLAEKRRKNQGILHKLGAGRNNQKISSKNIKPYELLFDFRFNHDKKLAIAFIVLILVGITAIFSSTIVLAYRYQGDKFYYLLAHLKWVIIGFAFLAVLYFVRIELITKLWFIPYGISILLLAYLFYLSVTTDEAQIDGATRWIQLGSFTFQPSDLAKLAFMIFLAAFLSKLPETYRDIKDYVRRNFMPFSGAFFAVILLILLGRNLGTALVVAFMGMTTYFVSANTRFQKMGFIAITVIMVLGGIAFGIFESYRADRIAVWTNYLKTGDTVILEKNADGTSYYSREKRSYQFDQVLTSCGSGGFMGQGLGQSIGKYYFVKTTAADDSIICIIGEEVGFPLTVALIMVYIYMVYVCLNVARKLSEKPTYAFLLIAFASWVGFQMFVHIGANIGVIPLTGQTLPFISYGGSSIISLMGGMGLALNASKQGEN